ncbi:hypothetical protein MPSEU_000981400 [Mayamaea pseudoterrestris]|nr:hypothetical protein MPSEU_000981400 [Mayamaea pseudoterrestris]
MMRFTFTLLATLCLLTIETANSQDSCAAQTAALQESDTISKATMQLQTAIFSDLQACYAENATSCPIDVTDEKENIASACEIEGGQVYTPDVEYSCNNDNTNVRTTVTVNYAACLGANCSTDEITDQWDAILNNVTDTANAYLGTVGIQCDASVSGAAILNLSGLAIALMAMIGSAMVLFV